MLSPYAHSNGNVHVFDKNDTILLGEENRVWVVTRQKASAESTLYELSVTAYQESRVIVDIIDYNPLTNIERVSKGRFPLPEFTARVHGPS